jgi:hypothetical protein
MMGHMGLDLTRELLTRFGDSGLRRYTNVDMRGVLVSENAVRAVRELGVPVGVAPYFSAAGLRDPGALGEYALRTGPAVATLREGWWRLGSDNGSEICVTDAGGVSSVLIGIEESDRPVNATVTAFIASLLALDEYLPLLTEPDDLDDTAVYRELRQRLAELDDTALADPETWWSRVLEDLRHEMSFAFSAAVRYFDDAGEERIASGSASVGGPHPEEVLQRRLHADGIPGSRVVEVYTELQPCVMPGHYCAMRMPIEFPQAKFTHGFDYGDTAEQRQAGIVALIRHAASQGE